jgi:hypothetical protein
MSLLEKFFGSSISTSEEEKGEGRNNDASAEIEHVYRRIYLSF